jgi:hypothetical protein
MSKHQKPLFGMEGHIPKKVQWGQMMEIKTPDIYNRLEIREEKGEKNIW